VDESGWSGSGPEFTLFRGGREWTLKVDGARPGLSLETRELPSKLLSLDRLAGLTRCDSEAFTAATLVEFERYRSSVRATFAPPSWGGLKVRASWSASSGGDAVDLEIQLSASSVGELESLEVGVVTHLGSLKGDESLAGAPDSGQLPGVPPARLLRPSLWRAPWGPVDLFYAEMVHPDDLARKIADQPIPEGETLSPFSGAHYALFGLALEKGVILRARLRGCWFRSSSPRATVAALYDDFLANPLPLGP
jgi:hypothetical protein